MVFLLPIRGLDFAQKLGFGSIEKMMDDTFEIFEDEGITFNVTNIEYVQNYPSCPFVAWNSKDLEPVYFATRYEAEDALTINYAHTVTENNSERFVIALEKIEKDLAISHRREGHCEHAGECQLVPVLIQFLEYFEGSKSLSSFGDWYSDETPSELFDEIFGGKFKSSDWIAENEIPFFHELVKKFEVEHSLAETYHVITGQDGTQYEVLVMENGFKTRKGGGNWEDGNYWAGFCKDIGVDPGCLA